MPIPDGPNAEIPGITRPYTTDEVLHSALHILNEVETVLTHLTDPETQQAITIAMRERIADKGAARRAHNAANPRQTAPRRNTSDGRSPRPSGGRPVRGRDA